MRILFSLLLISCWSARATCQFKRKDVYSLSGPVTKVLEEIGLMNQLRGISVFYPSVQAFKGETVPGGIFLAPAQLSRMKDSVVFFDQSHELRRNFSRGNITAVEINGRGKTPSEVVSIVVASLRPYLEGCDFAPFLKRIKILEEKILELMKTPLKAVFFLGDTTTRKLPELVIANDGLVLWLRKKSLVTTYPSELAYVNWSGAIIDGLQKDHLLLGLKEAREPRITGDHGRSTFHYPGILVPGLHQLEAWLWYLEHHKL